jgi:hypothetical protein
MVELNIVNFVTVGLIAVIFIALMRLGANALGKRAPV